MDAKKRAKMKALEDLIQQMRKEEGKDDTFDIENPSAKMEEEKSIALIGADEPEYEDEAEEEDMDADEDADDDFEEEKKSFMRRPITSAPKAEGVKSIMMSFKASPLGKKKK